MSQGDANIRTRPEMWPFPHGLCFQQLFSRAWEGLGHSGRLGSSWGMKPLGDQALCPVLGASGWLSLPPAHLLSISLSFRKPASRLQIPVGAPHPQDSGQRKCSQEQICKLCFPLLSPPRMRELTDLPQAQDPGKPRAKVRSSVPHTSGAGCLLDGRDKVRAGPEGGDPLCGQEGWELMAAPPEVPS